MTRRNDTSYHTITVHDLQNNSMAGASYNVFGMWPTGFMFRALWLLRVMENTRRPGRYANGFLRDPNMASHRWLNPCALTKRRDPFPWQIVSTWTNELFRMVLNFMQETRVFKDCDRRSCLKSKCIKKTKKSINNLVIVYSQSIYLIKLQRTNQKRNSCNTNYV